MKIKHLLSIFLNKNINLYNNSSYKGFHFFNNYPNSTYPSNSPSSNKVNLNEIFRNSSMMNVRESDFQKPNKNKAKWSKKKKFWVFGLIGFLSVAIISGCGVGIYLLTNTVTLYDKNGDKLKYNSASSGTKWISERTFSLLFHYETKEITSAAAPQNPYEAGTGWIYQADTSSNTYYVATNLHVANVLSFIGNTVTRYENNGAKTWKYSNQVISYVGIPTSGVNSKKYLTDIVYFPVSTPEVVYTTTTDSIYNNLFNSTQNNYYGLTGYVKGEPTYKKFSGAQDIAILKYTIDPSSFSTSSNIITNKNSSPSSSSKKSYISTFKSWLSTYANNPTQIYTSNVEDIGDLRNRKLYMGGFPSYSKSTGAEGNSLSDISWITFSDFTVYDWDNDDLMQYPANVLSTTQGSTPVPISTPIAYYSSSKTDTSTTKVNNDPESYNYASIGIQSTLNATSFAGSSGSPIVINENGNYMIAGIYWGGISSNNDPYFSKGLMTWFNTSSYKMSSGKTVSFKLTDSINSAINTSLSKLN